MPSTPSRPDPSTPDATTMPAPHLWEPPPPPAPTPCPRPHVVVADQHPAQHATDIRVHHGNRPVKRKASYRRRRIAANPRQRLQHTRITGDNPAVFLHDDSRRPLQVDGATVIAHPAPRSYYVRDRRIGQNRKGREPLQKRRVNRQHAPDTRLLQHELRHHRVIRIVRRPPRQIPPMLPIPPQHPPP